MVTKVVPTLSFKRGEFHVAKHRMAGKVVLGAVPAGNRRGWLR
jgi:hypothetical protein